MSLGIECPFCSTLIQRNSNTIKEFRRFSSVVWLNEFNRRAVFQLILHLECVQNFEMYVLFSICNIKFSLMVNKVGLKIQTISFVANSLFISDQTMIFP